MSAAGPDLSVIIVAYNGAAALRATLAALIQHTRGVSYEIIVVDNASPDPAVGALAAEFAGVRLVRNPHNQGFAAANNIGIRLSGGRFIALLNPDTLLRDDALAALSAVLQSQPRLGAVGPLLLQPDGQPQRFSYGAAPAPGYLLRRRLARLIGRDLHRWQGAQPRRVDWVAGTCLVLRRAAVEAVGLLDERFFLYFEDVDYGMRLNAAGWPVLFVPSVAIIHLGGGSVGAGSRPHYDRSLALLYRKHYGALPALGLRIALRLYRLLQRQLGPGGRDG